MIEKPPLDEDLLIHFGVKGMRWGRRKAADSGTSTEGSSTNNEGMSTGKKVAIGAGLVLGAGAAAYVISKYGGSSVPTTAFAPQAAASRSVSKITSPEQLGSLRKMTDGEHSHRMILQRLTLKKGELDNAVSLAKIDKLLKQPTPKLPTLDRLVKADQRSRRVASIKGLFRRPKGPTRLYPAQGILNARGGRKVTDLSDLNKNLMNFNDAALRRGGVR